MLFGKFIASLWVRYADQYPIYKLKLVAPTNGVNYQIETGARTARVYPNQIPIVTTSVIGPFAGKI